MLLATVLNQEMKVRNLLTRRTRRRKTSVGWRRWSNEYLYDVLGLYWTENPAPDRCWGDIVKVAAGEQDA
jgi:hypothetical protein